MSRLDRFRVIHSHDDVAKTADVATSDQRKPRKAFKTTFVQVPMRWVKALADADAGGNTYRLALAILAETFKCEQLGGDVVLSSMVTGMHRNSKGLAARELQRLDLIRIEHRRAKQSPLVHVLVEPK
jgi:hypothetical protein